MCPIKILFRVESDIQCDGKRKSNTHSRRILVPRTIGMTPPGRGHLRPLSSIRRRVSLHRHRAGRGTRLSISRLDGTLGVSFQVRVHPISAPTILPSAALSDPRREVSEFAAVGATAREVADSFDIPKNTVKQYLKNISNRPGIGSRAELAELMSRWRRGQSPDPGTAFR